MPPALLTPMLIGAAVGAVTSAISGGNILKGALLGAVGGAIGGAFNMAAGAAGGEAGGMASAAAADGAAAAATTGVDAAGEVASAVAPQSTGGITDLGPLGDGAAAGAPTTAPAAPTGMMGGADSPLKGLGSQDVNGSLPSAATPSAQPVMANTGLAAPMQATGLSSGATDTGMAAEPWSNPTDKMLANGTKAFPPSAEPSFIDQLLQKGSSMMNNRGVMDFAGRAVAGFTTGQQQAAKLAWQERMIAEQRQNARFGNIGSHYNTAGMMGPTNYQPQ